MPFMTEPCLAHPPGGRAPKNWGQVQINQGIGQVQGIRIFEILSLEPSLSYIAGKYHINTLSSDEYLVLTMRLLEFYLRFVEYLVQQVINQGLILLIN